MGIFYKGYGERTVNGNDLGDILYNGVRVDEKAVTKYIIIKENVVAEYILSDYINEALAQAVYEKLDDETYAGKIPICIGVIAFGKTLTECEEELHSTLEDWVLMGLKQDHDLPIIKSINLNQEIIREPLETV